MSSDVLGPAVAALASGTSVPQVLDRLASAVVPALAGWCIVDLLEPPDLVTRHVARGVDGPLELPAESGAVGSRRSSADAAGLLAQLAQAPSRPLHLGPGQLAQLLTATDPRLRAQAELAVRLDVAELLLLPLSAGGDLLGVLVVGRAQGAFDPGEVEHLSALAAVAGLALGRLGLLEVQRGVAAALQRTLLPKLPVLAGVTVAARFVPAAEALAVGGDWYDSFLLPGGDVAVVVGDATGHDVGAAVRMAELRNLLRALVSDRGEPPAATLSRLDGVLNQVAPSLSGTCVLAHLRHDRLLTWSSAGHLPPLLLRDGQAALLEPGEPELMLGVEPSTTRTDAALQLRAGDVVLLFTDGLVEHRSSGLDERLAVLVERVQQIGGDSVEALADRVVEELASGDDDVALLVLRIDA